MAILNDEAGGPMSVVREIGELPTLPKHDPIQQQLSKKDKEQIDHFQKVLSHIQGVAQPKLDQYFNSAPHWITPEETDLLHTAYDLRGAEDEFTDLKSDYQDVSSYSGNDGEELKLRQAQFDADARVLQQNCDQILDDLGDPQSKTGQAVLDGIMRMRSLPLRA